MAVWVSPEKSDIVHDYTNPEQAVVTHTIFGEIRQFIPAVR